jgi:hypothetical protein
MLLMVELRHQRGIRQPSARGHLPRLPLPRVGEAPDVRGLDGWTMGNIGEQLGCRCGYDSVKMWI